MAGRSWASALPRSQGQGADSNSERPSATLSESVTQTSVPETRISIPEKLLEPPLKARLEVSSARCEAIRPNSVRRPV